MTELPVHRVELCDIMMLSTQQSPRDGFNIRGHDTGKVIPMSLKSSISSCSIENCDRPISTRGWCKRHYHLWYLHGDASYQPPTTEERFWSYVNKDGPIPEYRPDLGPCWVWNGACNPAGYGQFWEKPMMRQAHRWAYEHFVGAIGNGLEPDHLCRVRACVNYDHLEPVTRRENTLRGFGPAGIHARKTHCIRGHPLSGENIYLSHQTWRRCKTCIIASTKRRRTGVMGAGGPGSVNVPTDIEIADARLWLKGLAPEIHRH